MDVPRKANYYSDDSTEVAVLYAACLCRRFILLALIAFADKIPI